MYEYWCFSIVVDYNKLRTVQASILYKSIAGRYRPVRVADRFIKNAYWGSFCCCSECLSSEFNITHDHTSELFSLT